MKKVLFLYIVFISFKNLSAQEVYPTHWWTGMKNRNLQLMIHGQDIAANYKSVSISYPGITVKKVTKTANPNYLFIDVLLGAGVKAGIIPVRINRINGSSVKIGYELKTKSKDNGRTRITGVNSEDFIYLIMPDRFSNGDPLNDQVEDMRDRSLDRTNIWHRHGGDLKGIENKLDYLQDLGVTALWLNPVIVNDMAERTEHGYAFTNHYKIDPRIGGEKAYHSLINNLHNRGMKIIQDAVYNHVGIEHFLYRDMPDSSWFHRWPIYTNTTYKDQVLMDPYASLSDIKRMTDGWFTPQMPDINQDNKLFATFLIQHAIWSTEEYGLDGWRIDTYAYNDLDFMNRCNKALMDEFPKIHLFGETWVHGIPNQSFFSNNVYNIHFKSNLPAVTDFQLNLYGIVPALTQHFGWTEGVNRLYLTATNDFVYRDPMKNVIFLDNHDLSRFFSVMGEDVQKHKMGLAWLLTFRGIPQMYYGTEIAMKNFADPDGLVRSDFPGGWKEDDKNKFESSGRDDRENEVFNYVRKLANFRKASAAIKTGKMMQFVPENDIYVYFRYNDQQTIMCIMNPSDKEVPVNISRFSELTGKFTKGKDVINNADISLHQLKAPAKTVLVMELE